jgi:hypothetical protein
LEKPIQLGPWLGGMINSVTQEQVPDTALVDAVNVNIDTLGAITPRGTWSLLSSGDAHSLFSHNNVHYGVVNSFLCQLLPTSTTQIQAVTGKLAWTILNGEPVFASYDGIFVVRGLTVSPLPYTIATDEVEYNLTPMPGGSCLAYWRGRLVVGRGNSLIFSEPLRYGVYDTLRNFIQFEERVRWIAPLETGLYVGLKNSVRWLGGVTLADLTQTVVGGSTWSGAAAVMSTKDMSMEVVRGALTVAVWMTPNGFAIGLPSGDVVLPQSDRLKNLNMAEGRLVVAHDRVTVLSS